MTCGNKAIYVVPSWHCNLQCPHCFVHLKEDNYKEDLFINKLKELKYRYPTAGFILHGGEPTLYKDRYFTIMDTGIIDSICTNLVIDPIILDDLNERQIGISTSWNVHRFNDSAYSVWIDNIKKLKNKPLVLITLDKDLINYDIYDFIAFLKDIEKIGIKDILFEPLVDNTLNDTFQDTVDIWLCKLHFLWKENNLTLNNILEKQILHWDFRCDSITLYPNGQMEKGCILGNEYHKILDKCLSCKLANVCRPCALHTRCSFYPKFYNLIRNA